MKRLLCLLLMLCLLPILAACGGGETPPEEDYSEGLAYQVNEDGKTCTVTGIGSCRDKALRIPPMIGGYRVTAIAAGAFKVQSMPIASVKAAVQYPGAGGSFADQLPGGADPMQPEEEEPVNAPKDEATNAALEEITSVELPPLLTDVGDEAFFGCTDLATIEAGNLLLMIGKDCFKETAYYQNPENWENGALYVEDYLVQVQSTFTGKLTVKEGTAVVADLACMDCTGITELSLPATLKTVGRRAFSGCTGLSSLTLSCYDLCVKDYAFLDCTGLESITVGMDEEYYARPTDSMIFEGNKSVIPDKDENGKYYVYPTVLQHGVFKGCTALKTVVMKKTVSGMLNGWFSGCTALRSVKLSDNMQTLGNRSFANCPELSELDLGRGLTSIFTQAIYNCPALTELVLPDGVKTVDAFYWMCSGIEKITFGAGLEKISWSFFDQSVFYYNGTVEQWMQVDFSAMKNKTEGDMSTYVRGPFTVKCLDGDYCDPNEG